MGNNHELSERERDIVKLVATGVSNKEIAQKLNITTNTVKVHLKNIFAKIGVLSRTEATLYAIEYGIVDAPGNRGIQTEPDTANWRTFFSKRQWFIIPTLTLFLLATIIVPWYLMQQQNISPTVTQVALFTPTPLPRWQEQAPMPEGRAGMAATMYENQIYIFAGENETGITGSTLRYDLNNGTWGTAADKPTPVTDIQAAMIGEKVYIPGGWTGSSVSRDLDVFNPRLNTWEKKASLPQPRSGYAMAALEGRLYLFGGWDGEKVTNITYTYNPYEDVWTELNPMPIARAYMSAVTIDNKIYIIGGWDGKNSISRTDVYFPNREGTGDINWFQYTSLPNPLCRYAITEITNIIYLLGMSGNDCSSNKDFSLSNENSNQVMYQFITNTNSWYRIDVSPFGIGFDSTLITVDNLLYNIGGYINGYVRSTNQTYHALYTSQIPIFVSP
jgi:DNA-binding CsgD family transcriptional regulator/N-acetylneuraminic acid mutarotase